MIDPTKQKRPTITDAELDEILASVSGRYHALFALLAGTGLRIGEALGLKTTDLSPDYRTLHVQRSIWGNKEQAPKTPNAVRMVDIPETLAQVLREHTVREGYLFATKQGRPLQQRNVLRVLHSVKQVGLHAFRRFRLTWLGKSGVPKDLERYWMGHAPTEVGDLYSKLKDDVMFRTEWAERAGLGFLYGPVGPEKVMRIDSVKVA